MWTPILLPSTVWRSPGGIKATPHKSSAAGWRVFSPIRAVWKTGNTPSIPLFSKLSAEEKSHATGSCRIVRCCLNLVVDENTEKKLADKVRQVKKDGLIDNFIYGSVSSTYLSAVIDTL